MPANHPPCYDCTSIFEGNPRNRPPLAFSALRENDFVLIEGYIRRFQTNVEPGAPKVSPDQWPSYAVAFSISNVNLIKGVANAEAF
ncbi:hypothetical protein NLI96_g12867 [Meripilus lineatus]|uniref:Uncharacterized protein n=1 Tax=Meripilus lineatus TaxID=2056292 RepID=A0AAD5UTS0_9APHY|nr:hypothetical protein NLI96_g12867 [Physisporinus lineatus]